MRSSIFYLLAPVLVRAGNLDIVGMGARGGEAVQAGQDITLTISRATETGFAYEDTPVTNFRVYLRTSLKNRNLCSLTGLLPAQDGNITVTIPTEMGPSGMYYWFTYDGYNSATDTKWTDIIDGYDTPIFYLTGGKGSWTPADTTPSLKYYGLMGYDAADIPCKSYPCAQQCAAKYLKSSLSSWDEGSDWTKCLTACDGVTLNTEEDLPKPKEWDVVMDSTVATPSQPCKEANLETTCGDQCCSSMEFCSEYKSCVELPTPTPRRFVSTTSKVSWPHTSTGTTAQATGAANALVMNWDLLGAAAGAGVFGIVGAGM
ncbi:hypothetical protein E8E13_001075 [Curvularia kusanoi]|uniref:Uncharacterized protein n=1 Tax=Curvularia kusanoi TaxID=90978 RepID=A0A9P4W688_CURKU|nr:hypothetical protein E8E13_001075 [Curvularia kusanoi]